MAEQKVEDIYIASARKLRTSLPKFVIFMGAAFLIWMIGSLILIPLGAGVNIGSIEAGRVINIIVIGAIIILIVSSFKEIRDVADASAGFVTYYVGSGRTKIPSGRIEKLQKAFRSLAYVILVSLLFIIFKTILDGIHPALAGIVVILIAIWAIIAIITVVMAMSNEVEEAARAFTEDLEARIKKRKK